MYVVGVVGEGEETAADRLTDRLGESGRVGTVHRAPTASNESESSDAPVKTAFELGDGWHARGENKTLTDVLDHLAPDHEYAVVVGFPNADIPQIVLGNVDCSGEVLSEASNPDTFHVEEVVTALEATEPHETLESLVAQVKRDPQAERSGAIATFTGRVRAKDSDDDSPTEYLDFEMYDGVAEAKLDAIRKDLEAREGVFRVLMHHRTGRIDYGEDIVFVVVLAGHRGEAFRTVEDGINRLKAEVPIFKREVTLDEQFWVHER